MVPKNNFLNNTYIKENYLVKVITIVIYNAQNHLIMILTLSIKIYLMKDQKIIIEILYMENPNKSGKIILII